MAELSERQRRAAGFFLLFALFCLLLPGHLRAGEVERKAETKPENEDYVLRIEKGLISLSAKDASIKQIVEEIGQKMEIEVDALISQDDRITVEFQALPLEEALKRLSSNYYLHFSDVGKGKDKISKIVLLSKGDGKGQSVMPQTGGADVRVVGSRKSPDKTAREQGKEAGQEKALKESNEKSPRPEPFKFQFNP